MKRVGLIAAGLALALVGCAKNPLGPNPGPAPMATITPGTTGNFGVAETLNSAVVYSPQTSATNTTYSGFHPACVAADAAKFGGGTVDYSWGGVSQVYTATSWPALAPQGGSASIQSSALILYSPGIGGPNGDFLNDYYVTFQGYKGPNASVDFCSLVVNLLPGTNAFVNLTCYRGFIFYARGNARFGVQLAAPKCGNCPYNDYNFYEYVFGDQLSSTTWKEFVVNFTDLQQLYGASVPLTPVLQEVTGLQFIQETPYVANFRLDIDYIRFF